MTSSDALTDVWEVPESLPTFAGGTYDAHVAAWRAVDVNVQKDRWTLAAIASSLIRSVGGSPRREQKRQETLIQRFIPRRRHRPTDVPPGGTLCRGPNSRKVSGIRTVPRSVDGALNALVSKLRSAMRRVGVPPPHGVATDSGGISAGDVLGMARHRVGASVAAAGGSVGGNAGTRRRSGNL